METLLIAQGESASTTNITEAFKARGHDVTVVHYFRDGKETAHPKGNLIATNCDGLINPADYDVAVLRSWGTAAKGAALLNMAERAGVPVLCPTEFTKVTNSKLDTAAILGSSFDVHMPKTTIHRAGAARMSFEDIFTDAAAYTQSDVLVFKADYGTRGSGIEFISNPADLGAAVKNLPKDSKGYLLQQFMGNPKEPISHYRIIVSRGKAMNMALKITAPQAMVPSNVSQGGVPEMVEVSSRIKNAAVLAARTMHLPYSGVDIMVDKGGRPYVLEVNDSPAVNTFDDNGCPASDELVLQLEDIYQRSLGCN